MGDVSRKEGNFFANPKRISSIDSFNDPAMKEKYQHQFKATFGRPRADKDKQSVVKVSWKYTMDRAFSEADKEAFPFPVFCKDLVTDGLDKDGRPIKLADNGKKDYCAITLACMHVVICNYAIKKGGPMMYELIRENIPCKFYIDAECDITPNFSFDPDYVNMIIQVDIRSFLCEEFGTDFFVNKEIVPIIRLDASTKTKWSSHYIICAAFQNNFHVGHLMCTFVEWVKKKYSKPELYRETPSSPYKNKNPYFTTLHDFKVHETHCRCILDISVYTKNRVFRGDGCNKAGDIKRFFYRCAYDAKYADILKEKEEVFNKHGRHRPAFGDFIDSVIQDGFYNALWLEHYGGYITVPNDRGRSIGSYSVSRTWNSGVKRTRSNTQITPSVSNPCSNRFGLDHGITSLGDRCMTESDRFLEIWTDHSLDRYSKRKRISFFDSILIYNMKLPNQSEEVMIKQPVSQCLSKGVLDGFKNMLMKLTKRDIGDSISFVQGMIYIKCNGTSCPYMNHTHRNEGSKFHIYTHKDMFTLECFQSSCKLSAIKSIKPFWFIRRGLCTETLIQRDADKESKRTREWMTGFRIMVKKFYEHEKIVRPNRKNVLRIDGSNWSVSSIAALPNRLEAFNPPSIPERSFSKLKDQLRSRIRDINHMIQEPILSGDHLMLPDSEINISTSPSARQFDDQAASRVFCFELSPDRMGITAKPIDSSSDDGVGL